MKKKEPAGAFIRMCFNECRSASRFNSSALTSYGNEISTKRNPNFAAFSYLQLEELNKKLYFS